MGLLKVKGMAPDVASLGKGDGLWDLLLNVRLRPEGACEVRGAVEVMTLPAPASVIVGDWVACTNGEVYALRYYPAVYSAGQAVPRWSGALFSGVPVLAPSNGVPVYRDGTGTWATLPGWPSGEYCGAVAAFRNHLVVGNLSTSGGPRPYMVRWSHPAAPGAIPNNWNVADTAVDAGEMEMADAEGGVVHDLVPMGELLAVVRGSSIWVARYVGPPFIFAFTGLVQRTGSWAPGAVAQLRGNSIAVFTGDDLVLVGPEGVRSLLEGVARGWLRRVFTGGRVAVLEHPTEPEVWLGMDTTQGPLAVVVNMAVGGMSVVEVPGPVSGAVSRWSGSLVARTWSTYTGSWDEADESWSFLGESRVFMLWGGGQAVAGLDEGEPLEAVLRREQLPAGGNPMRRTLVRLVEARASARPTVSVAVRDAMEMVSLVGAVTSKAWIGLSGETYDLELRFKGAFRLTDVAIDEVDAGISV